MRYFYNKHTFADLSSISNAFTCKASNHRTNYSILVMAETGQYTVNSNFAHNTFSIDGITRGRDGIRRC